jgi:signal transduction histidine kinase
MLSACSPSTRSADSLVPSDVQERYNALYEEVQVYFAANNLAGADSVLTVMEAFTRSNESTSLLIDLMNERAYFMLVTSQFEQGVEYMQSIEDTVRQQGTQDQLLAWITRKATFLNEAGRHRESIDMIYEFFDLTQDDPKHRQRLVAYTTLAAAYGYIYSYDKALEAFQQALELAIELDLPERSIATVHNNTATLLENMGRSEESLLELEKAMAINRRINNLMGIGQNLNNISNSLRSLGQLQLAADTIRYAIELNRAGGQSTSLIRNYYNLGSVFLDMDELEAAGEVLTDGYLLSTETGFTPGIMYLSTGLARFHNLSGNNELTQRYALESLELSQMMGTLEVQPDARLALSETYERTGRYREALEQYREFNRISDSLQTIRYRREIEEVRSRFEFDIITSENELLRQQLNFASQRRTTQAIILGFALFSGVLLVVSLVLLSRQKRQILAKNTYLSEINKSREELVNMIVHDLRSPLASLIATLDIIKTDYPTEDEDVREMLELADASGEKLRLMINGLLDVNSLEQEQIHDKIKLTDVYKIAMVAIEHYESIAAAKNIRIEADIRSLMPRTHPEYFARILDNLLSNAIKYSNENSMIRISLRPTKQQSWQLIVSDEGQGFNEKDKKDAFKMFSRLSSAPTGNESTTGVGLFIIKLLTEKLGGTVELNSEKNKGAIFTCTFPDLSNGNH